MLSATVVRTAAHCVPVGTTRAHVWFDPQVTDDPNNPAGGFEGTVVRHPDFTIIGYGVERAGPSGLFSSRTRTRGETRLVSINAASLDGWNVKLSSSGGKGNGSGGQCFGDSGGPVFVGDTTEIAAITSFGVSPFCTGVAYSYRVDTAAAQAWLAQFLAG